MQVARMPGLIAACLAAPAAAQLNRFDIRVSNVISPEQPSATVEVWAVWDPQHYAFAGAAFDVLAASDPGEFSNPERTLQGPGTKDGIVDPSGDRVFDIVSSQIHWPGIFFADTSNPILVWRATWGTSDFAPRTVTVSTSSTRFDIYIDDSGQSAPFIDQFTDGSGLIHVIPAPSAAAALAALILLRRRRP